MKLIPKCGKKTGSALSLSLSLSATETSDQPSRLAFSVGYNVIRPEGKVVPSRRYREQTYEAVKMDEITLGSAAPLPPVLDQINRQSAAWPRDLS
jgi:hypothetical protein